MTCFTRRKVKRFLLLHKGWNDIVLSFVFYASICRRVSTGRVCIIILYVNSTTEETWWSLHRCCKKNTYIGINYLLNELWHIGISDISKKPNIVHPYSCNHNYNRNYVSIQTDERYHSVNSRAYLRDQHQNDFFFNLIICSFILRCNCLNSFTPHSLHSLHALLSPTVAGKVAVE